MPPATSSRSNRKFIFVALALAACALLTFFLHAQVPHPRDVASRSSRSSRLASSNSRSSEGDADDDIRVSKYAHVVNPVKAKGSFIETIERSLNNTLLAAASTTVLPIATLCWSLDGKSSFESGMMMQPEPSCWADMAAHLQESSNRNKRFQFVSDLDIFLQDTVASPADFDYYTSLFHFASSSDAHSSHQHGSSKKSKKLDADSFRSHAGKMKALAAASPSLLLIAKKGGGEESASYESSMKQALLSRIDGRLERSMVDALRLLDSRSITVRAGNSDGVRSNKSNKAAGSWAFVVAVHVRGHAQDILAELLHAQAALRSLVVSSTRFTLDEEKEICSASSSPSSPSSSSAAASAVRVVSVSFIIAQAGGREGIVSRLKSVFRDVLNFCDMSIATGRGTDSELSVTVTCSASSATLCGGAPESGKQQQQLHLMEKSAEAYYSSFSPWCDDLVSVDLGGGAMKFGSKTGVYASSPSASAPAVVDWMIAQRHKYLHKNEQHQPNDGSSDSHARRSKQLLIKHYNFLQYSNGFAGLHFYLQDPVYSHPVIHGPTRACLLKKEKEGSDSVLQFQELVPLQMSLTKLMQTLKNHKRALSWPDRLDLSVQILCAFSFLHAHPSGPFSFDDNHPDQYLVAFPSQQVLDAVTASGGSFFEGKEFQARNGLRLKMVDIDTLQRAEPIYAASAAGNSNKKAGADRILPPRAKLSQPAFNTSMTFGSPQRRRFSAPGGAHHAPSLENYDLRCRCFYCRGRSNCLFVNSYEGYRACEQTAGAGDAGNAEPESSRKQNPAQTKRQCTLLTDSWYLGQLMWFLVRGDLLFPAGVDMHSVVRGIDEALQKKDINEEEDGGNRHDILRGNGKKKQSGVNSNKNDHPFLADHPDDLAAYESVIRGLLIERASPELALQKLQPLLATYNSVTTFSEAEFCPTDIRGTTNFLGLRINPKP